MVNDTNEEDMDDFNLDYEIERHWSMVCDDNDGGVDNAKAFIRAKRCYFYLN